MNISPQESPFRVTTHLVCSLENEQQFIDNRQFLALLLQFWLKLLNLSSRALRTKEQGLRRGAHDPNPQSESFASPKITMKKIPSANCYHIVLGKWAVSSRFDYKRTSIHYPFYENCWCIQAFNGAHCTWDLRGQWSASDSILYTKPCTGGVQKKIKKSLPHWQEINLQTQAWGLITHFIILACIALNVNLQWTKEIVASCCFEKEGDNRK